MKKGKYFLWVGLAMLLIGMIATTMSQAIIEDILNIERGFGEEPLSIKVTRYGLLASFTGLALMIYGRRSIKQNKR